MADTDGITWFERAVSEEFIDISEYLASIVNVSTEFLADIQEGAPADNFEFIREEDGLNAQQVTLNGGINDSVTTIAVATGHSARLRVGTILQNTENIAADATAGSSAERLVVTVITSDADITVATRGALSSTAKAHTDAAVFEIVGHADSEYGGVPPDESTDRAKQTENCQIFKKAVRTSWIRKFSSSVTVPDEEAYQLAQRTMEISELMDRACLNGMKGYVTITDRYYAMNGMLPMINTANGNRVTTADALGPTVINDLNALIFAKARQHELPTRLIARDNIIRYISRFGEQYVRRTASDRRRGEYVTEFLTDLGNVLQLVSDKNMPRGQMALYNPMNIKKRTLIPFGIFRMPEAKTSDLCLLMTVFGLDLMNRNELFAIHTNISVPS